MASFDRETVDYRMADTPAELGQVCEEVAGVERFAFDTETTGLDARTARIVGMSFSTREGTGWYVPVPLAAPDAAQSEDRP